MSYPTLVPAVYSFLNSPDAHQHLWLIHAFFSVFSSPFHLTPLKHIAMQNQCLFCPWDWEPYFCMPLRILGEWPENRSIGDRLCKYPLLPSFPPSLLKVSSSHHLLERRIKICWVEALKLVNIEPKLRIIDLESFNFERNPRDLGKNSTSSFTIWRSGQ